MNIKSLLIGSAAALVAVSGARAADAIVAAEPEPVEYVRVCDAFGTGFFYIPGTETCLRIDGYVRFRVGGVHERIGGVTVAGNDGYTHNTRVRINFDARSETELGTLRGYMRLQSNSNAGVYVSGTDSVFGTDQAIIQLGGLFMGYTESAFAALWGGGVGNFGILTTDDGGSYGYHQTHQIGYRYDAGAWYAALVLQTDAAFNAPAPNWTPDVIGVIGTTWGGAAMHLGYDETAKAVGIKGVVQFDVAATGGTLRVGGFYSNKAINRFGAGMPLGLAGEVANWSGGIDYSQGLTDTLAMSIGYQYLDGFSTAKGGSIAHTHLVEGALSWTPVTDFNVRLEGHYKQGKSNLGVKGSSLDGFVWARRSF